MPRRRVTMLEAFQVSAQKSVERAASEQRRLAEEREREARRAEVAKATQAWRRRIGDGVGSILSGFRGGDDGAKPDAEDAPGEGVGATAAEPPDAPAPDAPAARTVAPIDLQSPPASRELAELLERVASAVPGAHAGGAEPIAEPGLHGAAGGDAGVPGASGGSAPAGMAGPGGRSTDRAEAETDDGRVAEREALADALESVAVPEFALPMSGRTFGVVLGLALVTVFALGLSIGRGEGPEAAARAATGAHSSGGPERRVAPKVTLPRPAGRAGDRPAASPDVAATRVLDQGLDQVLDQGQGPRSEAQPPAVDDGLTPADRAFLDPRNRFAVHAVTYANNEANQVLAWEAYDDLAAAGFPVVRPVQTEHAGDSTICLLVGAGPDEDGLADLRDSIKTHRYGRKRRADFASATIVSIARYR